MVIAVVVGFCDALSAEDLQGTEQVNGLVLDEITVSATRREQSLSSVPASVHVLARDELRKLGAQAFEDYARTVPGLTFTDGGTGGEKQTIRGISLNPWTEVNPGTAVHLDEVPITSAGGTTGPPFNPDPALIDIERIEVLRGPQGTLFGTGAMGGAIRIITRAPQPDEFAAEVAGAVSATEGGEFGYRIHGMLNKPWNAGRAAVRTIVYQSDPGGFIDNERDGRENVNDRRLRGARVGATLRVNEDLAVTARAMHQDRSSSGLSHEELSVGKRRQSRLSESIEDVWSIYSVQVDAELGWGDLVSSTSWLDRAVDTQADVSFFLGLFFGLDNPLSAVNAERIEEFVQEFRLVSKDDGRFTWLAGALFQQQDQDTKQDFPSPGFDTLSGGLASMFGPPDVLFVRRETFSLEQTALYGEASYQFSDQLQLSAGGRWYDIDRGYAADNRGLLFLMGSLQERFSAGDTGFIPKLGLEYRLNDRVSLYASIAEGFRPGGINSPGAVMEPSCAAELAALGFSSTPTSYDSDSLVSYEAGLRAMSSRGRSRLSASVFHVDWSDLQTMNFLNCGTGFFQNAGAASNNGFEMQYVSRPTASFEYTVAASYIDAKLSEDVPNLGAAEGDRLPGVPHTTASASATYSFAERTGHSYSVGLAVQYVGSSSMDFGAATSRRLPAYATVDLRSELDAGAWTLTAFVNNLFNERGVVFINDNILGEWQTIIRPRTVGVGLEWRFR